MFQRGLGFLCFLAGSCVVCSSADLVSPDSFEGRRIVSVRFEPAVQPLPSDYLSRILPLKANEPFRMSDIEATISRLYATGRYADIAAEGEPSGAGVALVIRTRDQWFVGRVDTAGKIKDPPNRGQLSDASTLNLGQPYVEDDLRQATQNITTLLRNNGFYGARVIPHVTRDSTHQQVNVVFDVQPGKRARLTTPAVTGQPGMPAEDIVEATKWKWNLWKISLPWWKQDTQVNINTGEQNVRKMYAKRNRLASSVSVTDMQYDRASNTVRPTLNVVGGPKVDLRTAGAKISKKKLREYVPVYDEQTVDRDLLTEGAKNLKDYYQNQGYFDVEVDFQTKHVPPNQENIVYIINLGRRQKMVKVDVQGNKYFSTEAIRERMFIQPAGLIRLRHGRYSTGFARRDTDAIKSLYQGNGFRDVQVNLQTIDLPKRDEMAVVVRINEGPQYKVANFNLNGVHQLDPEQIRSQLSSIEGQPYSEINVGLDRSFIINTYNAEGFQEAAFSYSAVPGPKPNTFNVTYTISEGPRRYVRDLLIAGLNETRMGLIRPTIRVHPGDPISLNAMTGMQHNLYDLGIFDQVNMAVQNPDGDTPSKYVVYQIVEGHRYQVAGGFGAELARIGGAQNDWSNPGGATGFSPRASVDINRFNLWGLGHSATFKGTVSSLQQTASLQYLAPRYRNVDGRNILITALYDDRRDVRTFASKREEFSGQLSQKLSKANTVFWRLIFRNVTVDASTLKIQPLLIPLLSQPAKIGMVESSFVNDRRNDPANATRGMYNTLDGGIATGLFGSRREFLRFLGTNAMYHTFHNNWVFARRVEFGVIKPFGLATGIDPTQAIPLPERFFSGGSTSMRGFPDNQAGPRDPFSGFPLGGNALLIHNTELRFPFLGENIDGVLFHDMGNVYSSLSDISFRTHQKNLNDFNYMVHAMGFGIRYRTPLGPVRVDLAYSINPPSFYGFKGTTQQVLFGTAPRVVQNVSHFQFFFSIGQAF